MTLAGGVISRYFLQPPNSSPSGLPITSHRLRPTRRSRPERLVFTSAGWGGGSDGATLHHYDRIGLLEPEERSGSASNRRYGPGSVVDSYAAEARERWGETEAYQEARRRPAGYRAADWRAIRSEAGDIEADLATVLLAGEPADGERAMDLAERHRAHISRWFYECSAGDHRRLGELYVADWRFTKHLEEIAAGLAEFFRDAIGANAERVEES